MNGDTFEKINEADKKLFAFNELLKVCNNVEDMRLGTTQKTSLAWLVEELFKENPVQWQQQAREIRDEITKLNESSGKIGVSQFLSRQISEKYLAVLEQEIMKEMNEERKRSLEEMTKMVSSQLNNLKERESKNEATSFGGVSFSRVPVWFPKG
jgi:predicted flavoprotein YhiN